MLGDWFNQKCDINFSFENGSDMVSVNAPCDEPSIKSFSDDFYETRSICSQIFETINTINTINNR